MKLKELAEVSLAINDAIDWLRHHRIHVDKEWCSKVEIVGGLVRAKRILNEEACPRRHYWSYEKSSER